MIKFLTAALISLSFTSVWAMDLNEIDPNYSVKNIIKSKLWYEGIEIKVDSKFAKQIDNDDITAQLPEELTVALDKLDS